MSLSLGSLAQQDAEVKPLTSEVYYNYKMKNLKLDANITTKPEKFKSTMLFFILLKLNSFS